MRRGIKTKYFAPQQLAAVGNLQLIARSVVEGFISGLHQSPFKGFSTEFAAYREYMPGDDLRHFDWKVYARSDRRYIKEYEEETNMTCTILLDGSGSMGYSSDGLSKFEYSCFTAAALTYLMVKQRDQVGLVIFGETIRERVPARSSPAHMKFILDRMEQAQPEGQTAAASSLHAIATSLKTRGLVIVLSDLLDDPPAVLSALNHFRHDRHEVIVFHVLDKAELELPFRGLVELKDLETKARMQLRPEIIREEYLAKMREFLERYQRDCRASKIDYNLVSTDTPFEANLTTYLARRARSMS